MVFFKGRKINKLLDQYRLPQIGEKDRKLVGELEQFGLDSVNHVVEYFQQKKLSATKAQYILERMCTDTCKEIIIPLIGDPYDEVRRVAKEMIKKHWPKTSTKQLIQALDSIDIYQRNNATELLTSLKDHSCESDLIDLFNTTGSEQKKSIIKILGSFGTNKSNRFILSALDDSDWQVRLIAVKNIAKLKLPDCVHNLIELLDEQEPQIKKFTIEALGKIGDKQATRPLLLLLKDGDLMVRQKAVDSLIEIADAQVIPEIIGLLKDGDVNVRRCAVEILRNMKDPKTSAVLMQAIKDSDWWVRQIAADSLASLKSGNIVEGFIGLTKDPDENIRRLATEFFIQVAAPEAYDTLIGLLEDPDWWVRERAIDALGTLKDPRAIKSLLNLVDDQSVCIALPAAFAAIGGEEGHRNLLDLLYRGQKKLRIQAMKIMVKTMGQNCIDELKSCLADHDEEVRSAAIVALKELTGELYSPEEQLASSPLIQGIIAPGKTVTEAIVVIDLCNSTDIISRYGDSFAMNLMQRLTSIVNPIANREKCQFIKGTGDGFLLTFPKAENSIRFSLDVLEDVKRSNDKSDDCQKINLRFAINFGEAKIDDKGDRIGVSINMAFRIEGVKPEAAIPTEGSAPVAKIPLENRIFITENIQKEITRISTLTTKLVGLYELKGITGLHRVYHLTGTL